MTRSCSFFHATSNLQQSKVHLLQAPIKYPMLLARIWSSSGEKNEVYLTVQPWSRDTAK